MHRSGEIYSKYGDVHEVTSCLRYNQLLCGHINIEFVGSELDNRAVAIIWRDEKNGAICRPASIGELGVV